ncbi:kinase-like domain-containing protein [Stachybotrys elegans]|uniref:non-specific serine/threonine protein kinase n=1 Tax=Stachybotrys elegans TaxID=80388 RepID=A0A8K0SLZ8_9HYPO|nr:kinase-like domain-containing protein [Stachybotrys elegans]
MSRIPDLVQDTRLDTTFDDRYTVHHHDDSDDERNARSMRRAEVWQWEHMLARGGCGEVWLQRCVQGGRSHNWRAVKVVPRETQVHYISELEAIAKFSQKRYSKCFVKLFGWYTAGTSLCIAMEYFPLGDLQKQMSSGGPIAHDDVRDICFQIMEGLHYMHREGFAHRDIKPGNVLVKSRPPASSWWVKLSDFGISKRLEESMGQLSTVKGTVSYMAPELLGHEPGSPVQIDYMASDMWSAGEMTFRMLTKSATFSSHRALLRYLDRPDLFPSQEITNHGGSEDAASFIRQLMQPSPESRLRSGQALEHPWLRLYSQQCNQSYTQPYGEPGSTLTPPAIPMYDS